ncbi:MAG: amino acid dehydrogenase [Betaproteobacteria bacterium RIFCSPLOWO2_12_FULL_66_14]|nr:MAG: amino acid dehydrogenase [Betaproteobacteria bacterium RIFCSPLOWO2_12_FULL_66_14]
MKVVVLGAGLIGTASAWYLARAGHEVLVADRQPEPALETSFANGGQISVGHSEPWANPGAPFRLLRWLGREDAPLLFRPQLEASQWIWGLKFLLECLPGRARRNTARAFALALYSREVLRELRRETGLEYDQATRGILHFFDNAREFERACRAAELLRREGLDSLPKTPQQCVMIEPALAHAHSSIVGGIYTASDESGDARLFTCGLAERARAAGVSYRYSVNVCGIEVVGGRVTRVVIDDEAGIEESLRADAYVVAMGSYSPLVLRPVGVRVPVYPVKGYSMTLPLQPGDEAPEVSLTDDAYKLVFSRLGARLRVAGTAELAGYDTGMSEVRCQALVRRTFGLFPKAGRASEAQFWTGLRPATPSNLPSIGRTRYPNLYVNTGHGTLGWTMACGSGRALADLVSGRRPEVDFPFLGLASRHISGATKPQPDLSSGRSI